jgi:hypothetical protein
VRIVTITDAKRVEQTTARRQNETRLARWGRWAFAWLFLLGSISHFVIALRFREAYRDFPDWSPFVWVQEAWENVFMPSAMIFGVLIGIFEILTGALILRGGRSMKVGLLLAITFHVGLIFFGLWPWSVPMITLFLLLMSAQREPSIAV